MHVPVCVLTCARVCVIVHVSVSVSVCVYMHVLYIVCVSQLHVVHVQYASIKSSRFHTVARLKNGVNISVPFPFYDRFMIVLRFAP